MPYSKQLLYPMLLVFFEMVTYLSNDMSLPALPAMMQDFSITAHQTQWTLTSWFLGAVSVQLLLGPLSDRYGRKPVVCAGAVLFFISTLVCTITTNFDVLLVGRFIEGTGVCFIAVPGYASIHESFDQKPAIKILALMGSISVLAPAFGPMVGSLILLEFNWRWIFGLLVIWSFISMALLIKWMPETLSYDQRQPLEISPTLKRYWRILSNTQLLKASCILGFTFCGFITWIVAGPFLVIDQFHYSPLMFGLFQSAIFICYIFANNQVHSLIEKIHIQKLVRIGILICLIGGVLAFILAWIFPNFMIGMIIAFMIYSIGSGLLFAPLNRLAIECSDEPMGSRMAIFSTILMIFATLSSVLVSIFYNGTLLSIATIVLFVMILATLLKYKTIKRVDSHGNKNIRC